MNMFNILCMLCVGLVVALAVASIGFVAFCIYQDIRMYYLKQGYGLEKKKKEIE